MSSQFLQTELLNLIQESKRKNSDLRNAAEESLNDLKALPSTSEAQISADLMRKPKFVDPFILACHSRHAKLAGIGVVCLQRLVASRSLPSDRLKDVLGGLRDTTNLSLDIQLKILQSLPSLLQHYSNELGGELLVSTLEICATLQASKTLALSSTAAATLQQLVVATFERVVDEDKTLDETKPRVAIKVEGSSVRIGQFAYDALRVLDDLCRLVDGEQLQFLRLKPFSQTFTLELIESVLINSGHLFVSHAELTHILRARLLPMIVRYLSERHTFALTVRVSRILLILLKRHMSLLTAECEMALGLLTHLLEPDGTSPWKRVLCMEVFRGLYAEPGLVRLIYSLYDGEDSRKNILKDHMASLVRLASEKPFLIGVSNRSTVPLRAEHSQSITEEQITLEAGGVAGVIGATGPSTETNAPGISSQWSVVRTPYIELLDKTDPPQPPETYIYSLVLNCISTLAEGLAKFILPLTVPDIKQKRRSRITSPDQNAASSPTGTVHGLQRADSGKSTQRLISKKSTMPLNPLDLESHPQISAIRTCAGIIENCWPAILATCSTFLYASLDEEFYHNLVRSFQKLTHVAGLLRLSVPRDAFLTTLGKAAMPADTVGVKPVGASTTSISDHQRTSVVEEKRKGSAVSFVGSPFPVDGSNAPGEASFLSLSTRNLLCLRALLNLGIALGPTLDQPAWSIILGTLQDADLLIGMASSKPHTSTNNSGEASADVQKANLGAEISAVQAASAKMFESTSDYSSDAFQSLLVALLDLSGMNELADEDALAEKVPGALGFPQSQRHIGRVRRNNRLVTFVLEKSRMKDEGMKFVLEKANDLTQANLERLSSLAESDHGAWQLLTGRLIATTANPDINQRLRLRANEILSYTIFQTMKQEDNADDSARNARHMRNLETLNMQVEALYKAKACMPGPPSASVVEIHEQSLETLKSILEQYGETFEEGWKFVFDLISSVFGNRSRDPDTCLFVESSRLVRVAYKSVQMVASDFIALLPPPCRLDLVDSLSRFALQHQDFNISLTTTSSFWNVSDFLQGQIEQFSIESHVDSSVSEETLSGLAKSDDPSVSRNALWLLLLLRIVDLARDNRLEIRNCAIQTLLRIFDAYGQQLSPKAWRLCLNRVLFRMIDEIAVELTTFQTTKDGNFDELKPWIETAVVMVKGLSDLITTFFEAIVRDNEFDRSWERLLGYFQRLTSSNSLGLSEAVFSSLSRILLRAETSNDISKDALRCTWVLWVDAHPANREDMLDLERPNQDAASAYLQTFQQLYRLYKDGFEDSHIDQILRHMRLLAWNSISPRYSPDIDRPSSLQAMIIDCLKLLCSDKPEAQPKIIFCLADFVDSALTKWASESDSRRPTFVAFSKSAVELLRWYLAEFGIKEDIFSNGSLASALEHLGNPIIQRYEWSGKDRDPSLWQQSTRAALDILYVAVPYVEKQYEKSDSATISRFWKCVVEIVDGIASARGYRTIPVSSTKILTDESFDVDSFHKLKPIIIPSLGASIIPDSIRHDFARSIFHSSFIYQQQRFGHPIKYSEDEPLQGIYDIRPGRTFDPAPTPRARMAYVLMDTLFELASAPSHQATPHSKNNVSSEKPDSDVPVTARVLISRSVSPYLILRCAVSLKAYIADQPLRGLMPQPTPARKALLHLLRGMVDLRSEPTAVPDPPMIRTLAIPMEEAGAAGKEHHKKHLEWIYPLVVKAVQVAGKEKDDGEVLRVLKAVLDELSNHA